MNKDHSVRILSPLDLRIPPWDLGKLRPRACPFCGSRGTPRFERPDHLIVRACARCGAFFVSPCPEPDLLREFYRTYFSGHRRQELVLHRKDHFLVREMRAVEPGRDAKARVLASVRDLHQARALDVGFGMGQMLLLLQKGGADVHGIDLDPKAVAFARDVLHLQNVHLGDIADIPSVERFDVITLHDLVEHPLRPLDLLRRARSLMAPGGILSLWTPNASFPAEDSEPTLFRVDLEHMQYMSARTCNVLAQLLDLDILHLECLGHPDLAKIEWLSGRSPRAGRIRSTLRRTLGFLPGAIALNAFRRQLVSEKGMRGSYHLFCIFQRHG